MLYLIKFIYKLNEILSSVNACREFRVNYENGNYGRTVTKLFWTK